MSSACTPCARLPLFPSCSYSLPSSSLRVCWFLSCCFPSSVFRHLGHGSSFFRLVVPAVSSNSCRHSSQQWRKPSPVRASSNCLVRQVYDPVVAHSFPFGVHQSSCIASSVAPSVASVQSSKVILQRQVTVVDLGLANYNSLGGVSM